MKSKLFVMKKRRASLPPGTLVHVGERKAETTRLTVLDYTEETCVETEQVSLIIATIFIPLTFITGIHGMNFEYMPELKWRWAYFSVWSLMIIIVGGMFWFFRQKRWL